MFGGEFNNTKSRQIKEKTDFCLYLFITKLMEKKVDTFRCKWPNSAEVWTIWPGKPNSNSNASEQITNQSSKTDKLEKGHLK